LRAATLKSITYDSFFSYFAPPAACTTTITTTTTLCTNGMVWNLPSRETRASQMAFGTYSSTSAMCQTSPAIRRPALSRLRARIDCKL